MNKETLKPNNYINFRINEPNNREPQCYTSVFEDWDGEEDWVYLEFCYWGDKDYTEATQLRAAKLYIKQNIDDLFKQYESFRARDFWDVASVENKDELLEDNGEDWCPDISQMVSNHHQQDFLEEIKYNETKQSLYKKLCKYAIAQNANYSGDIL